MTITRKKTEFASLNQDLQLFYNYLTSYAFKFVQEQLAASSQVKMLNQKSSSEFSLSAAKNVQEPHTATPSSCDCSFFHPDGVTMQTYFQGSRSTSVTCQLSAKTQYISGGQSNITRALSVSHRWISIIARRWICLTAGQDDSSVAFNITCKGKQRW